MDDERRKVLSGVSLVFSRVVPLEQVRTATIDVVLGLFKGGLI